MAIPLTPIVIYDPQVAAYDMRMGLGNVRIISSPNSMITYNGETKISGSYFFNRTVDPVVGYPSSYIIDEVGDRSDIVSGAYSVYILGKPMIGYTSRRNKISKERYEMTENKVYYPVNFDLESHKSDISQMIIDYYGIVIINNNDASSNLTFTTSIIKDIVGKLYKLDHKFNKYIVDNDSGIYEYSTFYDAFRLPVVESPPYLSPSSSSFVFTKYEFAGAIIKNNVIIYDYKYNKLADFSYPSSLKLNSDGFYYVNLNPKEFINLGTWTNSADISILAPCIDYFSDYSIDERILQVPMYLDSTDSNLTVNIPEEYYGIHNGTVIDQNTRFKQLIPSSSTTLIISSSLSDELDLRSYLPLRT